MPQVILSGKVCQSLLLAQAAGCDDPASFQGLTNMRNSRLVVDPLHDQTQVGQGLWASCRCFSTPWAYQDGCSAAAPVQMLLHEQTVLCSRTDVVSCMLPRCTEPAAVA